MSLLETMRWPQVEANLKRNKIAILPIGSHEQHGRHMPFNTDTAIATAICRRIANRTEALVLPTICFGRSAHHMRFPGTITLRPVTFEYLITDVCECLVAHGVSEILVVNAHGGNQSVINETMQVLYNKHQKQVRFYVVQCLRLAQQLMDFGPYARGHADRREASAILALAPETVDLEEGKRTIPLEVSGDITSEIRKAALNAVEFDGALVNAVFDTDDVTGTGGWGSLEESTAELGEEIIETVSSYLARFVNQLSEGGIGGPTSGG